MRILRRTTAEENEEGTSYWMSFADLMAALLAIFVLAVVVLAMNLGEQATALSEQTTALREQRDDFEEQVDDLQSSESVRARVVNEIRDELDSQGIEVHVSENNSVLSIPSEQLGFESADHEISTAYEDIAVTIGTVVSEAIRRDARFEHLDTVFVEGHTDSVPHEGLLGTGNWGLSTFRAISLWALWEEELPSELELSDLQSSTGERLFSVSGYADTRPADEPQQTDLGRSANRRIDLRFTIVRTTSGDMEDLSERFSEP